MCGALGAAAAMLSDVDEAGIADAIGIAASMGSGLLEANRTGGTVKRVHCGWAAHAAVTAAGMARHGITGPPTVLEGRFGFVQAFCGDQAHVDEIVTGLGTDWELPGIFFKPYPCNHFTHAGIDAARRLRARGVDPASIVSLELGAPTAVLRTIGEPREDKVHPKSGYHAAFSGPYTVPAAFLGGGGLGVFHEDFTDSAAADPERLALAAKVTCVPDSRCDEIFPHQFPAVLRARRAGQPAVGRGAGHEVPPQRHPRGLRGDGRSDHGADLRPGRPGRALGTDRLAALIPRPGAAVAVASGRFPVFSAAGSCRGRPAGWCPRCV
ncbi:MmgE/PrpD family protein [Amycolatopsis sp. NPDC001370]|uniref:MmgE/PrpD family protein n=1 Tax=Amycolatopsis sp. NPDC001370 TaxID=3363923 RepID=UPI00368B24ED